VLTETLSTDPSIVVVGAAPNPIVARDMIKSLNPDVLTLDIEMPRMDGLVFLEKIMALRPMPVVMISSLTQKGADVALQALAMGAVDFVAKPTVGLVEGLPALREEIVGKVKTAAIAKIRPLSGAKSKPMPLVMGVSFSSSEKIIAVGASTGALKHFRNSSPLFRPIRLRY
jgi:two-component system chemotaxis response regulator CheB